MKSIKSIMSIVLVGILSLSLHAQAAAGFSKIGTATSTTFSDTSCPNQSTCYYQVTALDGQGFESQPSSCNATQLCIGGNTVVAVMPSSGTHSVALSWTGSTTSGVTYNIYRHVGPLAGSNLAAIVQ